MPKIAAHHGLLLRPARTYHQGLRRVGLLPHWGLFRIVDERVIAFFDRKKDLIIRGGFNISAAEVENILKGHPAIVDAAVMGMPDEVLGERTCAFVVLGEGATLTLQDVQEFMRGEGVANYKWPERIEIVREILRNPVGKVVKAQLWRELAEGGE